MTVVAFPAVAGGQEREIPTCNGSTATLWGTGANDTLVGTGDDDVIVGGAGDDIIRGFAGDDIICGGGGDDLLFGGSGDDTIKGGTGDDEIFGGTGDDLVSGWTGSDTLDGGVGVDRVLGNAGNDQLSGGSHDDILRGGSGDDMAVGGVGVDECHSEETRACERVALSEGDVGWAVRFLQRALRDRRLYRGAIDGVFSRDVAIAVATLHKVTGPAYSNPSTAVEMWQANPPSEKMAMKDWDRLLAFEPTPPKVREGQPDRVEIDIGHQVLYLILGNEVDAIVHVSTGYRPTATPRTAGLPTGGYFWYEHPYDGWSPRPGGWSIYQFWAYRAGAQYNYGVHGYPSVPYWPASHGCTRVEVWEADYLNERFFIGMPVHVWDQ